MTVDARLEERVRRLVDTYYIDYCLKPVLEKRSTGTAPATGTIELSFDVTREGTVNNPRVSATGLTFHKTLKKSLADELGSWRFPRLKTEAPPARFSHTAKL
ncbi:MAG: hypothetical protein GF418_13815 [Chitinivibrionales bacterium]|nr:hypothetical protein [Chitinivibrionales bacterium]MBD3396698.1 hypothetical protein [Chitinivibrionales bacterium]